MNFHQLFHCFIRRVYFSRITVSGSENVPAEGPVLALCLHRNGAVDGFVYLAAIPRLTFLIRAKLRSGLIGKLFFPGLDVTRTDDGGRKEELLKMIADSASALRSGSSLAIFPEGTSQLGPRHLPFQSGAARIALT
jgi:1-acyl-sn-glycerol-3-phosphate acyltransferase